MLAATDYQFLNSVLKPRKPKLSSIIVTAADSGYFTAVQALVASLKLSHSAHLVVCDLGFTRTQQIWLQRQGVQLFKPKLVVPKNVFFWQTWNKPFYLEQIYEEFLTSLIWIDADCIVTGSLEVLDSLAKERFVVFIDTAGTTHSGFEKGSENVINKGNLYTRYPVKRRLEVGEQPNAGIIGIDLKRDEDKNLMEQWQFMVKQSIKDNRLFNKRTAKTTNHQREISWYDQGCLQWAIEKCNLHHCILGDTRFNDPIVLSNPKHYKEFINKFSRVGAARIAHFPSGNKPYKTFPKNFNPDIKYFPEQRKDLQIFVLGHVENRPPKKHFLKYIHLPSINENNDLAESRFFFSNKIQSCKQEYIGLATAQWDTKYKDKCLVLEELHALPMQISRVWCADKSGTDWLKYSERDHKGISQYIIYLVQINNIQTIYRQVPWSNNFIAHKSVVRGLQQWVLNCLNQLTIKFGNNIKYYVNKENKTRTGSYLAERISMLYFCMRDDLKIEQIPCNI